MKNITYRSNFLQQNVVDGITELDLGSCDFRNFEWGELRSYRVPEIETTRPDIISLHIYGTTNYWWFILWFNGIMDIWNDIVEDTVLLYPSIDKVRDAFKLYSKDK